MLLTIAFNDSETLVSVSVPNEMRVADLCTYAAHEGQRAFSESIQLMHNGSPLDRAETLADCGLHDEDILVFIDRGQSDSNPGAHSLLADAGSSTSSSGMMPANGNARNPSQGSLPVPGGNPGSHGSSHYSASSSGSGQQQNFLASEIEAIRTQILYEPETFAQLSQRFPSLAAALHNQDDFKREYVKYFMDKQKTAQAASREIEENFVLALQEIPESFVPVQMLFALVEVNGRPIKVFIDSGAQATIMSIQTAEACGLTHLIDERYQGTAVGVGQATIRGRINMVPIKIGSSFFPCSMTVLEDRKIELLIGLDTLKHHQAIIDLKRNCLVLGSQSLEFLPESEIPEAFKNMGSTVSGENSDQSSSQAQGQSQNRDRHESGNATQSRKDAEDKRRSKESNSRKIPRSNSSESLFGGQSSREDPRKPAPRGPFTAQSPELVEPLVSPIAMQPTADSGLNEQTVKELVDLGFSEKAAAKALVEAGGNAEVAAALLFERDYPDA